MLRRLRKWLWWGPVRYGPTYQYRRLTLADWDRALREAYIPTIRNLLYEETSMLTRLNG